MRNKTRGAKGKITQKRKIVGIESERNYINIKTARMRERERERRIRKITKK